MTELNYDRPGREITVMQSDARPGDSRATQGLGRTGSAHLQVAMPT